MSSSSLVMLVFVLLIIVNECNSLRVSSSSLLSGSRSSIRSIMITSLSSSRGDDYDKMKIDKTKLNDKEKERIAYIEKLSLEADEMVHLLSLLLLLPLLLLFQIRSRLLDLD